MLYSFNNCYVLYSVRNIHTSGIDPHIIANCSLLAYDIVDTIKNSFGVSEIDSIYALGKASSIIGRNIMVGGYDYYYIYSYVHIVWCMMYRMLKTMTMPLMIALLLTIKTTITPPFKSSVIQQYYYQLQSHYNV